MAAGSATLRRLFANNGEAYERLDALGARLAAGIEAAFREHGAPWTVARVGSILWLALQSGDSPRRFEDIRPEAAEVYGRLHGALIERGIYLAPSAYEVIFVSLAHNDDVIDSTVDAFRDALREIV
jgi:glutamate-1-semialdehyde 2,1-aminomutase